MSCNLLCKIGEEVPRKGNNRLPKEVVSYQNRIYTPRNIDLEQLEKIIAACIAFEETRGPYILVRTEGAELCVAHRPVNRISAHIEAKQVHLEDLILAIACKDYRPEDYLVNEVHKQLLTNSSHTEENGYKQKRKEIEKFAAYRLYDCLRQRHEEVQTTLVDDTVLNMPTSFQSTLRPYQERTVKWLLKRETASPNRLDNLFSTLHSRDGQHKLFKHKLLKAIWAEETEEMTLAPGGILADEMGLGKTVEMLSLIVLHPRPDCKRNQVVDQIEELLTNPEPAKRFKSGRDSEFLCICNETPAKRKRQKTPTPKDCVQCGRCHIWQHKRCVLSSNEIDKLAPTDPKDTYQCPSCWQTYVESQGPIDSGATLIVTPNTIKMQWYEEIKKHIAPSLRVLCYTGVSAAYWISPVELGSYDIVLVDYNTLQREAYHSTENTSDRTTRNPPRTMRTFTPILMLNWWRVCLDEAQMVESNTARHAALVRTIPAIQRWAVTGTPIQRTIDDLYPLLRFIGMEDYLAEGAWRTLSMNFMLNCDTSHSPDDSSPSTSHAQLLEIPSSSSVPPSAPSKTANFPLVDILQKCMWRTCKKHVLSELGIPPQIQIVHRVSLNNIELLHYTEQHEECQAAFEQALAKYISRNDLLVSTSQEILKIIMKPLLTIRQCCIIPVLKQNNAKGRGAGGVSKDFVSPNELYEHLVETTEREINQELRTMASSYNGLAAIMFLRKTYAEAIRYYECVLRLARDYQDEAVHIDKLLQIHAFHNIIEALKISTENRDDEFEKKIAEYEKSCSDLEWKYIEPSCGVLVKQRELYKSKSDAMDKVERPPDGPPLVEFLADLLPCEMLTHLMARLNELHYTRFADNLLMGECLQSVNGLLFILVQWDEKTKDVIKKVKTGFKDLEFFTEHIGSKEELGRSGVWCEQLAFIQQVTECHLNQLLDEKSHDDDPMMNREIENRQQKNINAKKLCRLCKLRKLIDKFECLLLNKTILEDGDQLDGADVASMEISVIKVVLSFFRSWRPQYAKAIETHLESLETFRQFCLNARHFWIEIEYLVKAYDELEMCKMRITLAGCIEERTNFRILPYEVNQMHFTQQETLSAAQRGLCLKQTRLRYIKHLKSGAETGPCPICQMSDAIKYAVFECGHHFCLSCFKRMRQYIRGGILKCSICRNPQSPYRIYYVFNRSTTPSNLCNERLAGSYSSKISCILSLILKLRRESENQHQDDLRHQPKPASDTDDSSGISSQTLKHHIQREPLKILIFSQWQAILESIEKGLHENNIKCLAKWSDEAIKSFKNPNSGITCFLMPLSKGCKGLNIIEATHVILVEPILNPSEELQALGRVHRFGQTKVTTVHRFIVNDTIEENISNVVAAGRESYDNWGFDNLTFENLRELFNLKNNVKEDL